MALFQPRALRKKVPVASPVSSDQDEQHSCARCSAEEEGSHEDFEAWYTPPVRATLEQQARGEAKRLNWPEVRNVSIYSLLCLFIKSVVSCLTFPLSPRMILHRSFVPAFTMSVASRRCRLYNFIGLYSTAQWP